MPNRPNIGNILYWLASAIAIALVIFAAFAYYTATGRGALGPISLSLMQPWSG